MEPGRDDAIAAVRRFNRFYTRQIGVLPDGFLDSPFSLAEVRVLSELAHGDNPTASQLRRELGLDQGYLSRILRNFARLGLVAGERSKLDGRQRHLSLTEAGRLAFAQLNERSNDDIGQMLGRLTDTDHQRVVSAMGLIERALARGLDDGAVLREHRAGDMGWVVSRHGALYASEY